MNINTYIGQAQTRVQDEQEAVDELLEAYETFICRVRTLQPDQTPSPMAGITTAGGATRLSTDTPATDRCQTVRTVFAETIRPHSVASIDGAESLLETIRAEFTDEIAVALAPTTDVSFSPELKRMLLAEAGARRSEAASLREALGREEAHLDEAASSVDGVITWIANSDETPLTDLGFEGLKRRHETLASHVDCCEEVAHNRQEFLQATTSSGGDTGVRHRDVMPYLYQDFSVDHPVLATAATLTETCQECQRAVRDHLTRRG